MIIFLVGIVYSSASKNTDDEQVVVLYVRLQARAKRYFAKSVLIYIAPTLFLRACGVTSMDLQ